MTPPDGPTHLSSLIAGTVKPPPAQSAPAPPGAAPLPPADHSKFNRVRPPRPMLSREADSIYWLARYTERAEHVARLLQIMTSVLTDAGDMEPDLANRFWNTIPLTLRLPAVAGADAHLASGSPPPDSLAPVITRYMTFDPDNPNSVYACLTRARENARSIREAISVEMWECVNTLYWSVRVEDATARFDESPDAFYRAVTMGSMLFQGLTDQTIARDQRWLFAQLGKYPERIDVSARLLEVRYTLLRAVASELESPERNIHWMGVLRSACSIEAYRRRHIGDFDPDRVASFLLLEPNFPRSIRFCVNAAHDAIAAIRADIDRRRIDPAERILGRLAAQLEYAEMSEVLSDGVVPYLHRIQNAVAETALAVQKTYFLH